MRKAEGMTTKMMITRNGNPLLVLMCPNDLEEKDFIEALSFALDIRTQAKDMAAELAELAGYDAADMDTMLR